MSRTTKPARASESALALSGANSGKTRSEPAAGSAIASIPTGLRRRRNVRTAALIIPAAVAALASFWLGGLDAPAAARAAILGLAILGPAMLLRGFKYPHRLMPVSRFILGVLPVLVGCFVAGMLAISTDDLDATGLFPASALAMLAAIAVEIGGTRLLAARPLRIAVLGSPTFAAALRTELEAGRAEQVELIGWLNLSPTSDSVGESLQIGTLDSIRAAITEHEIDLLVRGAGGADGNISREAYDEIAAGCVDLPVRMIDGNQLYEQLFGHVPIGTIGSDWFLYLMHPSFEGTSPLTKRLVDLVGAGLASLIALPLLGLAAIAIRVEGPGPVFYRQRRLGEGGAEYEILKLRTMDNDAESDGAQWSVAGDQRITRVGRVLRRTHIDELPQILNVLRGEMTLVGPRPERPEIITELERIFPHYKRRLLVKPGVTGWAQVRCGYAGSELGTAWKLCHDLYYLKHRSLLADMLIMIETLAIAARDAHRPLRAPQTEFLLDLDTAERLATSRPPDDDGMVAGSMDEALPDISLSPRALAR